MAEQVTIRDFCKKVDDLGVQYFLCAYTGLNENLRTVLVPRAGLERALTTGAGGHPALYFSWPANLPEMCIIPDINSFIQLPWKPTFGWMMSDLYIEGNPFPQCPRRALKNQLKKAEEMGDYSFKTGVELEFVLTTKDGAAPADPLDNVFLSYQEPTSMMRQADFLVKMNDCMTKLGWGPYQIDREGANCQYEMNFEYADALTTADRVCFFKFMAKELAQAQGCRATFMAQPFQKMLAGSGMHHHMSLWRGDQNAFEGPGEPYLLSELGRHFIGGLLQHAEAVTAFACQTVNSYRRLNNAAWAPSTICYGQNNRTVMLRLPHNDRVEYRLPDGSCNPYLLAAAALAAGMDGIKTKQDPGEPCMRDISGGQNTEGQRSLPRNLLDALRALDNNPYLKASVGEELTSAFIQLRTAQWNEYMKQVTDWEQKLYLDC